MLDTVHTIMIYSSFHVDMIPIFIAGVLTGLLLALLTIYVAAKLQQAQISEGNKGKQELLESIKEQNMLYNAYRYVGKLIHS